MVLIIKSQENYGFQEMRIIQASKLFQRNFVYCVNHVWAEHLPGL